MSHHFGDNAKGVLMKDVSSVQISHYLAITPCKTFDHGVVQPRIWLRSENDRVVAITGNDFGSGVRRRAIDNEILDFSGPLRQGTLVKDRFNSRGQVRCGVSTRGDDRNFTACDLSEVGFLPRKGNL